MKRSQKLKMQDFLQKYGWITNRVSMINLNINNPFQRMKELREIMDIDDIFVRTKDGVRFKIFYIDKSQAISYCAINNLEVSKSWRLL